MPSPIPAQPLPFQVPEYLDLGPIADPEAIVVKKRKKKLIYVLAASLLIAIVAVGGYFYLSAQQNAPEAKLYRALDNNLRLSFVSREVSAKSENLLVESSAESDFSKEGSPKTEISTRYLQRQDNGDDRLVSDVKYSISSDGSYVFSIQSDPEGAYRDLKMKQWYSAQFPAVGRKDIQYDIGMREESPLFQSTSQGLVITGKFSDDQRSKLMDYIKANDIYQITGTRAWEKDQRQLTGYAVSVNVDKLNQLNGMAVDMLGAKQKFIVKNELDSSQDIVIWLDKSEKIAEISYTGSKNKSSTDIEKTWTFGYPDTIHMDTHVEAKALPGN